MLCILPFGAALREPDEMSACDGSGQRRNAKKDTHDTVERQLRFQCCKAEKRD